MINTIGPVWDGNEVWVLTAGGATFAAFPEWYATLFSGFYLPLLLILLALIVRGLAFEYRHQRPRPPGTRGGTARSSSARTCPPCCGASRSRTSSAACRSTRPRTSPATCSRCSTRTPCSAGVVTLMLFLTHGAMFLALKTDGDIRHRARALSVKLGLVAAVVAVVFLVWTQAMTGDVGSAVLFVLAALALVGGVAMACRRPRGLGVRRHLRVHRAGGRRAVRRRSSPT